MQTSSLLLIHGAERFALIVHSFYLQEYICQFNMSYTEYNYEEGKRVSNVMCKMHEKVMHLNVIIDQSQHSDSQAFGDCVHSQLSIMHA